MFAVNKDVSSNPCGEGVTRKLLGRGGNLMLVEVTFKKGAVGVLHAHSHEQVSYIANGSFEFEINGEIMLITKGDSVYIPPNNPHGTLSLEENSIIVDIFTPQREDFLEQDYR